MMWRCCTQSTTVATSLFRHLLILIMFLAFIESGAVLAQTSGTPVIGLSPSSLTFNGTAGGANPGNYILWISNTGSGTLSWTVSEPVGWLSLTPLAGTNTGSSYVYCNISGLAAGTYTANITVTAAGYPSQTKTVPVTLKLSGGSTTSPTIGYSPTSLSFAGTVGGTNPAGKAISISNTGGGTLSWTVSDSAGWLSVSPASGTNTGSVTASANLSGLAAGTYNGTITVSASGATNSPKTIPVSLTVSTTTTTKSATLTWTANTETDLAGYKVYRSTASGSYGAPIATLGKTTGYSAGSLSTGTTYFFVITAYDSAGNESSYSNEVSKSIY